MVDQLKMKAYQLHHQENRGAVPRLRETRRLAWQRRSRGRRLTLSPVDAMQVVPGDRCLPRVGCRAQTPLSRPKMDLLDVEIFINHESEI